MIQKQIPIQKLTGSPGSDSVSRVAKGEMPENATQESIREAEEIYARRYEGDEGDGEVHDTSELQECYAKLFEALAKIIRY